VLRSPNRCVFVFKDFLKESMVNPGCRNPRGRLFHSRGLAAEKLLSPSLLYVRGTNSFRVSFELERSGRRPASDRRQQDALPGAIMQIWRQSPCPFLESYEPTHRQTHTYTQCALYIERLPHNYTGDNMLHTVFIPQCWAVDSV